MKRIAIIPARGGSKRIKNKNIKLFCGKPMISHIIQTTLESNLFDKIHVSTDSNDIKKIVEKSNLEIDFMRPNALADDNTPLLPVLKYVIEEYKKLNSIYEEIWLLYPCAPLIEVSDIINASILFKNQKIPLKPLMAAAEYPVPIEWAFLKNENGILSPRFEEKTLIRSQDLQTSYFETGTFMIFPKDYIDKYPNNKFTQNYISYNLSKLKSVDIDDYEDWDLAEALYFYKKTKR